MANGSISIRCPGCGNPHPVAMAVGQQLQCSVCQTVFFAPVYDPEQHPESAPPVPNPSPSAPQAGLGNEQETREHAPAVPIASRPAAGISQSRSWRTEESEPGTTGQAPAPTLPVRSGSHLASAPSSAEQPAGGRIWTVISVIAGLLIVTTSLLVGVHLVRDWQRSSGSESADASSDVDVGSEPIARAAPTGVFHWSDAVLHAQRLGLLEVKVVRVKYGAVRAKDLNNEVITTDDASLLAITVSVHNRGAAACGFHSWYSSVIESADGQELLPALSDDAERAYSLLRFDDVSSIEGQRLATEIEPHQIVQDTVVFLVPTDVDRTKIRYFRLSLPAHAIGTADYFRFEIPTGMIAGWVGAG